MDDHNKSSYDSTELTASTGTFGQGYDYFMPLRVYVWFSLKIWILIIY